METIGDRIIAAREAKGLSREQLASRAEMSYSQLQRIEKGKHDPRKATLTMIGRALDMDPDELRQATPVEDPSTKARLDAIEQRLLLIEQRLDSATEPSQEVITAALASLVSGASK